MVTTDGRDQLLLLTLNPTFRHRHNTQIISLILYQSVL